MHQRKYPTTPVELFAFGLGIYDGSYLEDILEKERAYLEETKDKAIADSIEPARIHETNQALLRRRKVEAGRRQVQFIGSIDELRQKKKAAMEAADALFKNAELRDVNPMPVPLITDEDRAAADYAYSQQAEAENDAAAAQQAEYEAAQQAEAEYHYQMQQQQYHDQR